MTGKGGIKNKNVSVKSMENSVTTQPVGAKKGKVILLTSKQEKKPLGSQSKQGNGSRLGLGG